LKVGIESAGKTKRAPPAPRPRRAVDEETGRLPDIQLIEDCAEFEQALGLDDDEEVPDGADGNA
jgi:hypothetical protein